MTDAQGEQGGIPLKTAVPILVVLAVLVCVPIWLVKYPPLVDWPLHAARWYLLSLPQDGQGITEFYQTRFQPIPNLGMDLLMMVVMKFVPPLIASKLAACLVLIGLLTGGFAFSVALHKKVTWAAFLPVLALYDQWFLMGFANYLLGIGLAFWAVAVWLWLEDWPKAKRWWVLGLLGVVLLVTHLMAFAVACLVVVVLALFGSGSNRLVNRWLFPGILGACGLLALALFLIGKTPYSWEGKLQTLGWLVTSPMDVVFILLLAAGLGGFKFDRRALTISCVMLALALLGPSFLGGTAFACDRLTLPFMVLLFAGLRKRDDGQRTFAVVNIVLILSGVIVKCIYLGPYWMQSASMATTIRGASDDLPQRSTLVTCQVGKPKRPTWRDLRHIPDWILLDKPIFVAQNFAKNRQQPMVFRPEFEEFHAYQNNNPIVLNTWSDLDTELPKIEAMQWRLNQQLIENHRSLTDLYVLVTTDDPDRPAPVGTAKVSSGKDFVLLKVDPNLVRP